LNVKQSRVLKNSSFTLENTNVHQTKQKACPLEKVGADWGDEWQGVSRLGFVDADELVNVLAQHRVFVSPVLGSTGINTKNLLALEHGV